MLASFLCHRSRHTVPNGVFLGLRRVSFWITTARTLGCIGKDRATNTISTLHNFFTLFNSSSIIISMTAARLSTFAENLELSALFLRSPLAHTAIPSSRKAFRGPIVLIFYSRPRYTRISRLCKERLFRYVLGLSTWPGIMSWGAAPMFSE